MWRTGIRLTCIMRATVVPMVFVKSSILWMLRGRVDERVCETHVRWKDYTHRFHYIAERGDE